MSPTPDAVIRVEIARPAMLRVCRFVSLNGTFSRELRMMKAVLVRPEPRVEMVGG